MVVGIDLLLEVWFMGEEFGAIEAVDREVLWKSGQRCKRFIDRPFLEEICRVWR
jgi:hypothetical protein